MFVLYHDDFWVCFVPEPVKGNFSKMEDDKELFRASSGGMDIPW